MRRWKIWNQTENGKFSENYTQICVFKSDVLCTHKKLKNRKIQQSTIEKPKNWDTEKLEWKSKNSEVEKLKNCKTEGLKNCKVKPKKGDKKDDKKRQKSTKRRQ